MIPLQKIKKSLEKAVSYVRDKAIESNNTAWKKAYDLISDIEQSIKKYSANTTGTNQSLDTIPQKIMLESLREDFYRSTLKSIDKNIDENNFEYAIEKSRALLDYVQHNPSHKIYPIKKILWLQKKADSKDLSAKIKTLFREYNIYNNGNGHNNGNSNGYTAENGSRNL